MLKKLLPLFAGLLLAFVAHAAAEVELRNDHPDTYVVQRGDTLWDIASKFLKKPWLWPEVWQANPQVKNPHLIYPGDVINLAYLNGRARISRDESGGPRVRATPLEDAIPPIPLSALKTFLRHTRLVDDKAFRHAPHVVSIEENQLRGAHGNLVYVKGMEARAGDRFAIVRPATIYYSMPPKDDGQPRIVHARPTEKIFEGQSGLLWHWGPDHYTLSGNVDFVGYEVLVVGEGQVTRAGDVSSVLVTYSDIEVRQGDLLLPVEDKPYDSQYVPHAPVAVPPEMRVLAFTDAMNAAGPLQVVALSRGSNDGIENGHTFSIYHAGEKVNDDYQYKRGGFKALFNPKDKQVQLPEEFVGHVMIFRTFDQISYGLVMSGIRAVHRGDILRAPE